jgi:hypothetical protein
MRDGELKYTLTIMNNETQKASSITFDSLDKLREKIIGNATSQVYDFINIFEKKDKE